jgi:hypothetical protein
VEQALDELKQTYGRSNILPLIWHRGDYYETPEVMERFDYYGVTGVPNTFFDGVENIRGGYSWIYDDFEPIVLDHLEDDPYIAIDLSNSTMADAGGTLNIRLEAMQELPWDDVDVKVVLYEDGILDEFCVRDILATEQLTISLAGEIQEIQINYIIDPELVPPVIPENSGIIVFLQSYATKQVLNACELSMVDVEITPETTSVPMGTDLEFTVGLQNITPYGQSFDVWVDVVLPNGTEHPANPFIGPVSPSVPGDWSYSKNLSLHVPDGIPTLDYQLRVGVGVMDQPDHWQYDYMTFSVTE